AGLKSVEESVKFPWDYYYNNVSGTLVLCKVMEKHKVNKLVFSSSASVYGNPKNVPISENFPLTTESPYARTKLIVEEILHDFYKSNPNWSITLLRYFNPLGAHHSGVIGE